MDATKMKEILKNEYVMKWSFMLQYLSQTDQSEDVYYII